MENQPQADVVEEASTEEKQLYAEQLAQLIFSCLDDPGTKHGLLIIADDVTRMLSLFSINAEEMDLPELIDTAAKIVHARAGDAATRVIN